jgi:hypothetical protein
MMRRAAKLMFFSAALFPLFVLMSVAVDEPGPIAVPAILFFASLMWMVYSRLFIDDTVHMLNPAAQQSTFGPMPTRMSLTPPTNISDFGRQQVRTNELAQAPSVTEHTTKLLDQD